MRTACLLLLAACTGTPSSTAPADPPPPQASEQGSGGFKGRPQPTMPSQDAPAPSRAPLVEDAVVAETGWRLEDGRSLQMQRDRALLAGESVGLTPVPGGATLSGERTFRLVTPCAAALYERGRWVEAERVEPACPDAERLVVPQLHVTWTLPGGDRYTVLPEGRVWRRGERRKFKRPVGSWERAEGQLALTFGSTVYDLVSLDPCHTVFALRKPSNAYRATRTFPACDRRQATYDGLPWSLWKAGNGDLYDLRGEGAARLDDFSERGAVDGTWTAQGGVVSLSFGERAITVTTAGCGGSAIDGESTLPVQRVYPPCAQDAESGSQVGNPR